MKAYVNPIPKLSPAMDRVASALKQYAPSWVEITHDAADADFQVLHAISDGVLRWLRAPNYAVIQYCRTAVQGPTGANVVVSNSADRFRDIWAGHLVWSYYDLTDDIPDDADFYYAPLGVDPVFQADLSSGNRDIGIVTVGHVDGPGAEAISDAAKAAQACGLTVAHIGPASLRPFHNGWGSYSNISDDTLASLYGRAQWVSGLRYCEGFELPVIEGMAMGTQAVVFDRPEMRHWYGDVAHFVPECHGEELVRRLTDLFKHSTQVQGRETVLDRFNWEPIATGFWERVA